MAPRPKHPPTYISMLFTLQLALHVHGGAWEAALGCGAHSQRCAVFCGAHTSSPTSGDWHCSQFLLL